MPVLAIILASYLMIVLDIKPRVLVSSDAIR